MKLLKQHRSIALILLAMALSACRGRPFHKPPILPEQNMFDQPKFQAQQVNNFFPDKRAMRMPVKGTVARGWLKTNTVYWDGKTKDGKWVQKNPLTITKKLVDRGKNRFNIYCTPCHDRLGTGNGMVIQFGFVHPPSYHSKRLRNVADGYLYNVITNGFAVMPSYRDQIPVHDRWAIVSYIRALQLSQHATKSDLQGYTFSDSTITAYKDSVQAAKEAAKKQAEAQAQKQQKVMSVSQLIALGKKLHKEKTCVTCHSTDGSKGVGPTWQNLFGRKTALSNGKTITADVSYIKESIMKPHAQIVKGFQPVMPQGLISSQQNLNALVAYIASLSNHSSAKQYLNNLKKQQQKKQSQSGSSNSGSSSSSMSQAQLISLGKKLYKQKTCTTCHSTDGSKGVGPTWKGLYQSTVTLSNGKKVKANVSYLKESIKKPHAQIVKGFQPVMPQGLVSKKQNLDALVAYIKSLK
ncbi:MAG TPA: c-type cytochrome [Balneolales bacterium]|nr:c-type cytochrome [Balneolales bacterium]